MLLLCFVWTFGVLLLIFVKNLSVSYISHLFLATEVVTVFVFQEPSLLSSLQDNGLTDVMLHALLIKDVSPFCCSVKNSQCITPFHKIYTHTCAYTHTRPTASQNEDKWSNTIFAKIDLEDLHFLTSKLRIRYDKQNNLGWYKNKHTDFMKLKRELRNRPICALNFQQKY